MSAYRPSDSDQMLRCLHSIERLLIDINDEQKRQTGHLTAIALTLTGLSAWVLILGILVMRDRFS